jgi:lipopolysaccharide exporter
MGTSLRQKATRGTAFLATQSAVSMGLGLVRLAVLARLLAPVDFGLVALALVVVVGLENFTNFGARQNVIQRGELSPDFLGNIWTFSILRGVVLSLLLLPFMQWYATTLEGPHALTVLSLVAFVPAVRGLMNPSRLVAERQADFGRIVVFEVGTAIMDFAVTLGLALHFGDARALAWGLLGAEVLRSGVSYAFFGRPPRIGWDRTLMGEIFDVGRHFLVLSIGTFLLMRASHFVAGHMGTTALAGVYVLANRLADVPIRLVLVTIRRVAFPVLSRIQDDKEKLRATFMEMLDIQLFIYVTALVGLNVFATALVLLLYGPKWNDVVPVLHALTLLMAGRGLANIVSPYVLATGAFSFASRAQILAGFIFLCLGPAGMAWWGLPGLALGTGAAYAALGALHLGYCLKHADISVGQVGRLCWLAVLPNLPAVAVGGSILWSAPSIDILWTFGATTAFILTHLVTAWFFRPRLARRLLGLLRRPKVAISANS